MIGSMQALFTTRKSAPPEHGFCPLKFGSGANIGYECEGKDCAWFTDCGRCVMVVLATGEQPQKAAEVCICGQRFGDNPKCPTHGGQMGGAG